MSIKKRVESAIKKLEEEIVLLQASKDRILKSVEDAKKAIADIDEEIKYANEVITKLRS